MRPACRNNYQLIGANPSNNDNLQTRINQTISAKDGLDVNFNYQHRNSENIQPFGFVDPTSGYGLSGSLTYRRTIQPQSDQQSGLEFQPQYRADSLRIFEWREY